MLTKWAEDLLSVGAPSPFPGSQTTASGTGCLGIIPAKDVDGHDIYITNYPYSNATGFLKTVANLSWNSSGGLAIGSSDAELTNEAYDLASRITTIDGSVSNDLVTDAENNSWKRRFTFTLQNNTSEDVTVKEVGLFASFCPATTHGAQVNGDQTKRSAVLLSRDVLSTPVTVPANGAATFRYIFEYKVPTEE